MNEITFEKIKKANGTITTTDIKGKEYAEVNQRIKAFRMVYPTGFIRTQIVSLENGVCVIKAEAGYQGLVLGVGHAYEREGSTYINKTSYIENCETSAVGRALGMMGFGIDTSVCSAEELQNALLNQEKPTPRKQARKETPKDEDGHRDPGAEPATEDDVQYIKELANMTGSNLAELCKELGVKGSKLTNADFLKMKNYLEEKMAKMDDYIKEQGIE